MPDESVCKLTFDTSLAEEFLEDAEHAIESGEMTEEEAAETLASFVRFTIEADE